METISNKQISMEYKDLTECMNCFAHPSIQVHLNNGVLPEMSGNYYVSFNNIIYIQDDFFIMNHSLFQKILMFLKIFFFT